MTRASSPTNLKVLEMWNDGQSSGVIAETLAISRGAVSGMLHRMRAKGAVITRAAEPLVSKLPERRPVTLPPRPALALPPPSTDGIGIFELERRSCRWPIGGDGRSEGGLRYCGVVAQEPPYCPHHSSLAYANPLNRIPFTRQRK